MGRKAGSASVRSCKMRVAKYAYLHPNSYGLEHSRKYKLDYILLTWTVRDFPPAQVNIALYGGVKYGEMAIRIAKILRNVHWLAVPTQILPGQSMRTCCTILAPYTAAATFAGSAPPTANSVAGREQLRCPQPRRSKISG